jgi:hypothetical protein
MEAWWSEVSRMVGSWKPGGQKSPGWGSWKPGGQKSPVWLVLGNLVVRSLQDGLFLETLWPDVSRIVGSWKPGGLKSPGWLVLGSLVVRSLQDGWFLEA